MKKFFIKLYIAGVIVTFGHAWNRVGNPEEAILAAPTSAAFWPLYWSVIAWEK